MMTMQSEWGVPDKYQDAYDGSFRWIHYSLSDEARAVSAAANWFAEQDRALIHACMAADAVAIREWRDAVDWREVARETGGTDDDAEEYAEQVHAAFSALADEIDASRQRYGEDLEQWPDGYVD